MVEHLSPILTYSCLVLRCSPVRKFEYCVRHGALRARRIARGWRATPDESLQPGSTAAAPIHLNPSVAGSVAVWVQHVSVVGSFGVRNRVSYPARTLACAVCRAYATRARANAPTTLGGATRLRKCGAAAGRGGPNQLRTSGPDLLHTEISYLRFERKDKSLLSLLQDLVRDPAMDDAANALRFYQK